MATFFKRSSAVLVLALVAIPLGCRSPTEAIIDISTDGTCSDVGGTGISVGPVEKIETKPYDTTTSACEGSGDIGSMVLLPPEDGEKDAPFAFKVVTSLDGPAEGCVPPAYGPQCIVARRAMRFVPHLPFHVPVRMRQACAGVLCPANQSCVDGTCRSITVDPTDCEDPEKGCDPTPGVVPPWDKHVGGTLSQMARHLTLAADGTLAVTGNFQGSIDLGGGAMMSHGPNDEDIFLATYSPAGLFRWAMSFGGTGLDEGAAVAIDAHSDVYLGVRFQNTVDFGGGPLTSAGGSDMALLRLSSFGKLRWAIRLGGPGDESPTKIAVDSRQNVYVVGEFSGSADFAGTTLEAVCYPGTTGCTDGFLASFTASGTLRWVKPLGGKGNDGANGVGVDAKDNVYVGGFFQDEADVGGPSTLVSKGTRDVFLASFDKDGSFLWQKSFGGKGGDILLDLSVRGGRVVATGGLANAALIDGTPIAGNTSAGGFVAAFDLSGKLAWAQGFGSGVGDNGAALDIAEDGSVVVGGETYDGSVFGIGVPPGIGARNPFVAVLEADGTPRWARSYAASMYAGVTGVGAPKDGSAYLAGYFVETLTLDKPIKSDGAEDMFLWHVTP